jgi:LacI family transcriptional regulator
MQTISSANQLLQRPKLISSEERQDAMPGKAITIEDVAGRAGVSKSTVSRVLAGSLTSIPISDATRARVMQVARELGYRPHPGARSLSSKHTHLLGVIVREISDPFFAELIEAVSSAAKDAGYDLVLGNAKRDPERALALRDTMLDLRYCDGILLCGDLAESPDDHRFLSGLGAEECVVSVARGNSQLVSQVAGVAVDNRTGTLLALNYLLGLGHRQIACLATTRVGDFWERLQTYREFIQLHFGDDVAADVRHAENSLAGGHRAAIELLTQPTPPTALFALDDVMAIGALCAVADLRINVPKYVSIIGFDDNLMASFVRPALTTIRQPVREIGERAVSLLVNMIEGQAHPGDSKWLRLNPELVVRDSCGPARR